MYDFAKDFDEFRRRFPTYRRVALELASPNPEDDEFVRAAIVGFSRHAPTENWGSDHFEFLRQRRERDYSCESLSFLYGDRWRDSALLACMSLGCLLGLFQVGRITDEEFLVAELQLPGMMALSSGDLPEK